QFTDQSGNPLVNKDISINQKTHDFNFGCSIFLLDELESSEKNQMYMDKFRRVFNYAIAPFYWKDLEPEQGKPRYDKDSYKVYRRPSPDLVLEYCEKYDVRVKGHCIVYHAFTPSWMPDDIAAQKNLTQKHMEEIADRYSSRINDWDIENENLCSNYCPKFRLYEEPDYLEWCFSQADRAFSSGNRLFINEASFVWQDGRGNFQGYRSPYYMQIDRILQKGIRLDAIGLQFHQFVKREDELKLGVTLPFDPIKLYEVMDCYGSFGLPLHISEITIPSYTEDINDEETQAELCEKLYRTWFSHPANDAIVYWNLVDGYTYGNENQYAGGLLHKDLSDKIAFKVLDKLINHEWNTKLKLHTDENGCLSFEGYYGNYEAVVSCDTRCENIPFHLRKDNKGTTSLQLK
ncbi:MAG: glycoside hydrolase family 10, partial [Clostridiales bacterium]|nr:glycoside hydrolase family 10 [Clostridiales bacterium]